MLDTLHKGQPFRLSLSFCVSVLFLCVFSLVLFLFFCVLCFPNSKYHGKVLLIIIIFVPLFPNLGDNLGSNNYTGLSRVHVE